MNLPTLTGVEPKFLLYVDPSNAIAAIAAKPYINFYFM